MACDFKGKCVAKELLDLCMMKWRDSMEFLLESHSTVEKSYRLVYSARNKRCNLPAALWPGLFIKMKATKGTFNDYVDKNMPFFDHLPIAGRQTWTVEKSYRLVYSARNKQCNLPAALWPGLFINLGQPDESYQNKMKVF